MVSFGFVINVSKQNFLTNNCKTCMHASISLTCSLNSCSLALLLCRSALSFLASLSNLCRYSAASRSLSCSRFSLLLVGFGSGSGNEGVSSTPAPTAEPLLCEWLAFCRSLCLWSCWSPWSLHLSTGFRWWDFAPCALWTPFAIVPFGMCPFFSWDCLQIDKKTALFIHLLQYNTTTHYKKCYRILITGEQLQKSRKFSKKDKTPTGISNY